MIERTLLMKNGDEEFKAVTIQIGAPQKIGESWWASVDLPWHTPRPTQIAGIDSFQAMQLAIEFVEKELVSNGDRRFFWPAGNGEPPEAYEGR